MPLFLAPLLALGLSAQVAVETLTDRGRGSHIYRACQALDRIQALAPGQKPDAGDQTLSSECWGYIEGWLDALLDGSGALAQRGVCPHEFTIPQMAHGYVVYVEKHKEIMNIESGVALRASLKEQFPCPKK